MSCPYCKVNMCSLVNWVLGLGPFDDDDDTWVSIYSMGRWPKKFGWHSLQIYVLLLSLSLQWLVKEGYPFYFRIFAPYIFINIFVLWWAREDAKKKKEKKKRKSIHLMIFLNYKFECLQTPLIQYDDKFGEWIIQIAASKINQHNIISNIIKKIIYSY